MTEDIEIHTTFLDTFDRSEITTVHEYLADDFYQETYLTGQSGAQGFSTVLDELNQYTHSLAVEHCYRDFHEPMTAITARDGVLTFLYYVEKYLQLARTQHPADYDRIKADEDAVHVLDVLWGRANLYLDATRDDPTLGIADDEIAEFALGEANKDEIRRVIGP